MFPSNLHKNILQLDKQISLLESECKVIEMERRKKCTNNKESNFKCSKVSNSQSKSPPVKDTSNKRGYFHSNLKGKKKLTSPVSSRAHSTGSLPSKCSKQWDHISGPLGQKKEKEHERNLRVCSCQILDNHNSHCDFKKESKCVRCVCCNDISLDLVKNNKNHYNFNEKKQDQILHKEVLFSNAEGTIEVTVTQKPSIDKQHDNLRQEKTFSVDKDTFEKHLESCKCQLRFGKNVGQKWSEILWMNSTHKTDEKCNNVFSHECVPGKDSDSKTVNKDKENQDSLPRPVQCFEQRRKSTSELKTEKNENPAFCCAKESCFNDSLVHFYENNPTKVFQLVNNKIKQKQNEEGEKNPVKDVPTIASRQCTNETFDVNKKIIEENKSDTDDPNSQNYFFLNAVKKLCDGLMNEKKFLSEKLVAKDNIITTMKNREEEYLSLISNLKSNLDKAKRSAQESVSALKELDVMKQKLIEQAKVSEALKLSHSEMQGVMEKCILENERLKTEIQIFKLESQKHDVLLAGKEAEIKRYKEEIENFQKQISYHLSMLKSNAQEIDVEKMMEAIIQQSQIFIQTDLESIVLEQDQKDSHKQNNKLMHSSPTSTKTSAVNSSWKQISSIRDNEQNQENIDNMYGPNNSNGSGEKEFFPIFGADVLSKSDSLKEALLRNPSGEGVKKSSSVTTSVQEDNDWLDLSTAKDDTVTGKEKEVVASEGNKGLTSQKLRSSIDELLENMKMKWSKQIYDFSPSDKTIEDFLNSSQISSFSVNNDKEPFMEMSKQ